MKNTDLTNMKNCFEEVCGIAYENAPDADESFLSSFRKNMEAAEKELATESYGPTCLEPCRISLKNSTSQSRKLKTSSRTGWTGMICFVMNFRRKSTKETGISATAEYEYFFIKIK